jgi:hypothetical protein
MSDLRARRSLLKMFLDEISVPCKFNVKLYFHSVSTCDFSTFYLALEKNVTSQSPIRCVLTFCSCLFQVEWLTHLIGHLAGCHPEIENVRMSHDIRSNKDFMMVHLGCGQTDLF